MPYRKQEFIKGEIYHIVVRGIDDNLIFKNKDDYYRGIFSIYEFNTIEPIEIRERRRIRAKIKKSLKNPRGGPSSADKREIDKREKLVEILAFCFMPNHIHLLLKEVKQKGITKFMRKLGTGYGGYFNRKYDRKGYVFQNRFLAVHIKNQKQLETIFVYIHTNPISLIEPKWKERGIRDSKKVGRFLNGYRWSSYLDYIGKKNFPSVSERSFLTKIIGGEDNCKELVNAQIKHKEKIERFSEIYLE